MRGETLCTNLDAFSVTRRGRYSSLVVLVAFVKSVHYAYILLSDEKNRQCNNWEFFLKGKCIDQKCELRKFYILSLIFPKLLNIFNIKVYPWLELIEYNLKNFQKRLCKQDEILFFLVSDVPQKISANFE